jgi:hypothetical protein
MHGLLLVLVRRSCAGKGPKRAWPKFSTDPFSGRELVHLTTVLVSEQKN